MQLLTGRDFWNTWPLREDRAAPHPASPTGPSGVRGETWDERDPSLNLPSATALASSWDPGIARRYGAAAAVEARRKGVDVVLGPTINLHRSPLGGRHFECFSEDPVLTAELAAAYVAGVQDNGVGATPKHYVANDSETDRFTVDVRVDERALRELYLLAFEKAVVEARAWLVMSAYNSVNGVTVTENDLLETPLNSEWGFDGVVVSDWTAVRSLDSARASQDLVMPGPDGPWGDALVAAVRGRRGRRGRRRPQGAAHPARSPRGSARSDGHRPGRAGARSRTASRSPARPPPRARCCWRTDGEPAVGRRRRCGSVAVIGHNAADARTQGGGSATVLPERHRLAAGRPARRAARRRRHATASARSSQEGVAELPLDAADQPGDRRARRCGCGSSTRTAPSCSPRTAARPRWSGSAATRRSATSATLELDHPLHPDETRRGPARLRRGRPRPGLRRRRALVDEDARRRGHRPRRRVPRRRRRRPPRSP